jgi:hypothetical protein
MEGVSGRADKKQKSHSRAHRQQSTPLAQPQRDALQPHALEACSPATRRDGVAETPFKRQPGPRRTQPPTQPHQPAIFMSPHRGAAPRTLRATMSLAGRRLRESKPRARNVGIVAAALRALTATLSLEGGQPDHYQWHGPDRTLQATSFPAGRKSQRSDAACSPARRPKNDPSPNWVPLA